MKSYTDIEQSQKLMKLGIDVNTADMFYIKIKNSSARGYNYTEYPYFKGLSDNKDNKLPCWSLVALLDVINQVSEIMNQRVTILVGRYAGQHWYVELLRVQDESSIVLMHSNELVDACYEMIVKLHELKLL
jgi:hypothetical protein